MLLLRMIFVSGFWANVRTTMAILLKEGIRIGLVALALEILVVSFAPHYRRQIFDEEFTGGFPLAVDASGQRGEVVPQRKSDDAYRILILGDSISFGTGVSAESAWPAQLRQRLDQSDIRIECINAAAPGRGLRENLLHYEDQWKHYQPDLVLVAVSNNMVALSLSQKDLTSVSGPSTQPNSVQRQGSVGWKTNVKRWSKELASPSWLSTQSQRLSYALGMANHHVEPKSPRGPMLAYGYQQADLPPELAEAGWELLEEDLGRLKIAASDSGAELMAVTFPVRFELSDAWIDNEKWVSKQRLVLDSEKMFKEACMRSEITVIESGAAFRSRLAGNSQTSPSDWYLHFDFSHFSGAGHDVIATAVAERLTAEGTLRQN